jgi:hypothetical protein
VRFQHRQPSGLTVPRETSKLRNAISPSMGRTPLAVGGPLQHHPENFFCRGVWPNMATSNARSRPLMSAAISTPHRPIHRPVPVSHSWARGICASMANEAASPTSAAATQITCAIHKGMYPTMVDDTSTACRHDASQTLQRGRPHTSRSHRRKSPLDTTARLTAPHLTPSHPRQRGPTQGRENSQASMPARKPG